MEQLAPLPQEEEAGPEDRQVDFAALAQKNSEIVGWIYIPDSKVDYPMVKGTDNSYYVSHTFEKKANGAGAIFLDWKNKGDFSDRNTVIYGHHMKNGSMFAALVEYKDPDYFNAHRTIYLYTPQGVYTATVFSAYVDVATGPQTTISSVSYTHLGRVHGGVIAAILDEATGRAICHLDGPDSFGVTVELSIRYRKPVPYDTELKCVGRITRNTRLLFEAEGEVLLPDGTVAASAHAKYMKMDIHSISEEGLDESQWRYLDEPVPDSISF